MPRRNRVVSFLLMPIAVFLWCIGWSLYWIGVKKETTKPKPNPKLSVQKELVVFVPAPEQNVQPENRFEQYRVSKLRKREK